MTAQEKKNQLKQIRAALKKFPKVVADKKKNHKAKEKIIAAFMPMARKLQKQVERNKKSLDRNKQLERAARKANFRLTV